MAIYHLHHSKIGKSTHKEGTAGAHFKYITRSKACSEVVVNGMPEDKGHVWLKEQEAIDRKNARVCDKLTIALPIELNHRQNVELAQDFIEEITKDKVPYAVAIHDQGKDEGNPHAHIIIRDREIGSGKRYLLTSERSSTERFREQWGRIANKHLERASTGLKIDHRTLEEQGIEQIPQIHVGPENNTEHREYRQEVNNAIRECRQVLSRSTSRFSGQDREDYKATTGGNGEIKQTDGYNRQARGSNKHAGEQERGLEGDCVKTQQMELQEVVLDDFNRVHNLMSGYCSRSKRFSKRFRRGGSNIRNAYLKSMKECQERLQQVSTYASEQLQQVSTYASEQSQKLNKSLTRIASYMYEKKTKLRSSSKRTQEKHPELERELNRERRRIKTKTFELTR